MERLKLAFKYVSDLIIIVLIVCVVYSIATFIKHGKDKNHVPSIGSYKFLSVLSGSMSPVFNTYDLIVVKEVYAVNLKQKDIITAWVGDSLVTHRVIEIIQDNKKLLFKTKGDANNVEDSNLIQEEKLVGRYLFRIPYLGLLLSKVRSPIGVGIMWALLALLIAYEELNSVEYKKKAMSRKEESKVVGDIKYQISIFSGLISDIKEDNGSG